MSTEEPFIIETNEGSETSSEEKSGLSAFPVRTQLLVLGSLLFVLFAGVIIPKSFALLAPDSTPVNTPLMIEENVQAQSAQAVQVIEEVSIAADAAFVWDVANQKMLYSKNADEVLPLASITKLMTALVAYEVLPDNTPVTISPVAAAQQSGGSLTVGEQFEVKELADFALISSYNSAAYTLALSVGERLGEGDPAAQFVTAMNIRAEELGLESLSFSNPTGLDISATKAGAYGNAEDVSKLMEYILREYPEILLPTLTDYTRLYNQNGDYHDAHNTNTVLHDIPNLLGTKTGYTDLAGGNLTIAFDAGFNRPIIITVLGSSRNERFSDVKKLVSEVQSLIATNP